MPKFLLINGGLTVLFSILTISRLHSFLMDRPRPQGIVTDQRSTAQRLMRRLVFLVDPHRRKKGIGPLMNAVMVKEFRSRRFGRSHWLLRLIALSALFSLYLAYAFTTGSTRLGVETIGMIMVVLQVALLIVITPSLAANLISAERESGGWELLMMTPLSATRIVTGKLISVVVTLSLVLFATLPGYLVLIWIHPPLRWRVWQVLICMAWMLLFSVMLSAAVSSLCRRAAVATTIAYTLLGGICVGTFLFWLGRDTTFGYGVVETALKINPAAAAMNIVGVAGFTNYDLVPANWWWMGGLSAFCAVVLLVQTWRLTRPQ
jgi:ABC-type transport system involved in multi-copper enzyme maturation permease subunit